MAKTKKEIADWLSTFKDEDLIAIDEGGWTLVECGGLANLEVGGEPEKDEEEAKEAAQSEKRIEPTLFPCAVCEKMTAGHFENLPVCNECQDTLLVACTECGQVFWSDEVNRKGQCGACMGFR